MGINTIKLERTYATVLRKHPTWHNQAYFYGSWRATNASVRIFEGTMESIQSDIGANKFPIGVREPMEPIILVR